MKKALSNRDKVYKLLKSSSEYVFTVEEIALITELSERQVYKAIEGLKRKGLIVSFRDPYSGSVRGRTQKYYGVKISANTPKTNKPRT